MASATHHDEGGRGRLAGRRIVISGAASGIGRATAELFAREGARVAILDANVAGAEAVAKLSGGAAFQVDVRHSKSVERAVAAAATAFGGLDGLVNAAGIVDPGPILDITDEMWARTIDVNLTGTFYMCRAACRYITAAPHATIVNIASGQGLLPGANMSNYAASKGGVIALTRALAIELAPVRVNSVCPGIINTPMAQGTGTVEEMHARARQTYALKRIGDPLEVANAILFLSSGESSYVTGVALATDGGRTFH